MFEEIVEGFVKGEKGALSKAISFVERFPDKAHLLISEISKKTGRNLISEDIYILGITGPPGIGKSTLVSQLVKRIKGGVILCDPSSVKVEGGAILGDRIRIHIESTSSEGNGGKNGVFIRSIGTRGEKGGISVNTNDIINLYILFGFKNIIIETAGTGQTETEISKIADTVILVLSPESGDEIQFMKSGILEIADIIVLNKADRPMADRIYNEIRIALDTAHMVLSGIGKDVKWKPPIIKTIAKDGVGIDELMLAIEQHKAFLKNSNYILEKRKERVKRDFVSGLTKKLFEILENLQIYRKIKDEVLEGKKDPYSAIEEVYKFISEKMS